MAPDAARTPGEPPSAGSPVRRDWLDVTVRLATSWVGLFTAYVVALVLALTKFKELTAGLRGLGIPAWLGVALIAAFPVFALVFSTIPSVVEQRRIKRYSEITGEIATGYFTLRPRDEGTKHFERSDGAHHEILLWTKNTNEPVLYLTGASGTGKSSLLSAWVIPALKRENHVVIPLRGYEDDVLALIRNKLVEPGVIWDRAPSKPDDLTSLLQRAAQRLNGRRLLIVIDQFEEFLILKNPEQQQAFRQFLAREPIDGVAVLLVYRPEYEGIIQEQSWPRLQLDVNRKAIFSFTENAAQDFIRRSGLTLSAELTRAVLREAAEIDPTVGLIRPVTLNLCGLVFSRFASGLPHQFRGGLIRGFLRESLALAEVRDVAGRVLPHLITDNVTKRPRTVAYLVERTGCRPSAVRACLRRLGESDRAILRPLDREQETWEISHDFLVPLLDSLLARRTVSWWRKFRPWMPWTVAGILCAGSVLIPLYTRPDATVELRKLGWTIGEYDGMLAFSSQQGLTPESLAILRRLRAPFYLVLSAPKVKDIAALKDLHQLARLALIGLAVRDISPVKDLTWLTSLDLRDTKVEDWSPLRTLRNLTYLNCGMSGTLGLLYGDVEDRDLSPLRELKNLTDLDISNRRVKDISALKGLTRLTRLNLSSTYVRDLSPLEGLTGLTTLNLHHVKVKDISPLKGLKSLTDLNLSDSYVFDLSPLKDLKNLTTLDLSYTSTVKDITPLRDLTSLGTLNLWVTGVKDISPLKGLKNLKISYAPVK